MLAIEVITPPSTEPVTTNELKAYLRLNISDEDSLLDTFIKTAREIFEFNTNRAVMATTFRQYYRFFGQRLYMHIGKVTAINNVKYYDSTGTLTTLTDYESDIHSVPASVWMPNGNYPTTSFTKSPKVQIEYVAGFATLPENVKTAIKLLAAHFYENRAAHVSTSLKELPDGFRRCCDQYRTGVVGAWSEHSDLSRLWRFNGCWNLFNPL